jgi:hypothetical protein
MVLIVHLPFSNNGYKGKFGQKEINNKGKTWFAKVIQGGGEDGKDGRAWQTPTIIWKPLKSNKPQRTEEGFTIAQQYYAGNEIYFISEDGSYECSHPSDMAKDETLKHTFSVVGGKFDAGTTKSMQRNANTETCLLQYKEVDDTEAKKILSLIALTS